MSACASSKRSFRRPALEANRSFGKIELNVDETGDSNGSQGVIHQEPAIPPTDGRDELLELLLWSNQLIDVVEIEDDVEVLSSSGDFSQGRPLPQRAHPVTIILDDDLDLPAGPSGSAADHPAVPATAKSRHGQKRPLNQALADENDGDEVDIRRPKRDQPMHAVLKCAICWGPMAEETTTTCGHVFCKQCIGAAIRVQKRCPTCRKSLTMRNIHRIYLPTVFSGSSA